MNISSLTNMASSLPQVARPNTTSTEATGSRPHGTHHTASRKTAEGSEAKGVRENDGDGDDNTSTRVSNLADKINTRLENAINSGSLTPEQASALKDAAAKFTALMNRIANAGAQDVTKRAVHMAMSQLHEQVQGIFQGQGTDDVGASEAAAKSGTDLAAAITAPTVDTLG
ncbi:MAG: hypothetical protein IPJ19_04395 [Planctomycetes bacterium]|nr:hypothetical protein [Planctomycetota bacterium]